MRLPFQKDHTPAFIGDFPIRDAAYYEARRAEYEKVLAETPALPPITDLLPLKDPGRRCPKCGNRAVTIEYHRGYHKDCPDHRMNDWGLSWGGFESPETQAKMQRIYERAIEHHDRACINCKHRWVEGVRDTRGDTDA